MLIDRVTALEPSPERAILINCSTRLVSTLALLSTLRYARTPTLVVDCESTDGSMGHFRALMERYAFDLLPAPLRSHGETLDHLFREVPADRVLLVDSDAEILTASILASKSPPSSVAASPTAPDGWTIPDSRSCRAASTTSACSSP